MKKTLIVTIFLLGCSLAASASYITLNNTITAKTDGKVLNVLVTSINRGDESAYNVQAEIRAGGQKLFAEKQQELGVNQIYKGYAGVKLGALKPGQYPLVIVMHYTDANQYPFSALNCQTFAYQTAAPPAEIFGGLQSATFWKEGAMKLSLKNLGAAELLVLTSLVTPRELSVKNEAVKLTLPPKSEKKIVFELANFSALSGSNYQLFAVSEYEKDGIHYTSISPGVIKIVETKTVMGVDQTYIIAGVIVLILVFLVFQFGLPAFKQ
ncbi:MAG: hypothetical protein PHH60_03455 [Candidatus Margulisbacteria bacterium]|nr:hypothetical protein [Candidatus Margulisiibacteriota bacterium]